MSDTVSDTVTTNKSLWTDEKIQAYAWNASTAWEARHLSETMKKVRDDCAQEIARLEAEVSRLRAEQWVPMPDDEYPMVENAELDGDFLYITGNTNMEVCTWVERPVQTIMLDLGMKICRKVEATRVD